MQAGTPTCAQCGSERLEFLQGYFETGVTGPNGEPDFPVALVEDYDPTTNTTTISGALDSQDPTKDLDVAERGGRRGLAPPRGG